MIRNYYLNYFYLNYNVKFNVNGQIDTCTGIINLRFKWPNVCMLLEWYRQKVFVNNRQYGQSQRPCWFSQIEKKMLLKKSVMYRETSSLYALIVFSLGKRLPFHKRPTTPQRMQKSLSFTSAKHFAYGALEGKWVKVIFSTAPTERF